MQFNHVVNNIHEKSAAVEALWKIGSNVASLTIWFVSEIAKSTISNLQFDIDSWIKLHRKSSKNMDYDRAQNEVTVLKCINYLIIISLERRICSILLCITEIAIRKHFLELTVTAVGFLLELTSKKSLILFFALSISFLRITCKICCY